MRVVRPSKQFPVLFFGVSLICVILFTVIGYGHYKNQNRETPPVQRNRVSLISKDTLLEEHIRRKPVILLWGRKFQGPARFWYEYPGAQKIRRGDTLTNYILKGVRQNQQCCDGVEITANKTDLERATAIVMFHQQIKSSGLPKVRKPNQLWVLFGKDSPNYSADLSPYNDLFNWTMNYRTDSNVPIPFGDYAKLDVPLDEIHINGTSIDQWISQKRELLIGVISNCNTTGKREDYVKALGNEGNITVDIYGKCGIPFFKYDLMYDFKCTIWNDLAQEYKFFFAAENSFCSDYVTETFWRSLELGMVPVAYGGADYQKFAPPDSFIDVREFQSAKELADYLVMLDKNLVEYKKFFEWRKKYQVQVTQPWENWCGLCQAVKEFKGKVDRDPDHLEEYSNFYEDLGEWWTRKAFPVTENACGGPMYS